MPTSGAAFRLFNKDGDSPIHASITISYGVVTKKTLSYAHAS